MESLTDEHVLAAYADGFDLDDVVPTLRGAFGRFAASGAWPSPQVLVVDKRQPPDPNQPELLPQWDLGLNLGLDHLPRFTGRFTAVESVVGLLRQLATDTGREFVLLLCFRSTPWRQEHLTFVGTGPVDLSRLQEAIIRFITRHG